MEKTNCGMAIAVARQKDRLILASVTLWIMLNIKMYRRMYPQHGWYILS